MALKKKRRRSAAQRAATRRMRAALEASRQRSKKKARRSKRKPLTRVKGCHRPVVHVKGGRRFGSRRSTIPSRATFVNHNPFLGELAMIGNPKKKSKKSKKRRYSNPALALAKPFAAATAAPREMIRADFLKEATSAAVGFVVPNMVLPMLPLWARDARWKVYASKVAVVAGLTALAGAVASRRVRNAVLLGGGMSLLLDAYADFVAPALGGFAPRLNDGVDAYYGEPTNEGVGAYYGEATNVGVAGFDDSNYGNPY